MMNPLLSTDIILSLTMGLCILVSIRAFYLRRVITTQTSMLKSTTQSLERIREELNELQLAEKRFDDFKHDLNQAEIFTQVQKSRTSFNKPNERHTIPERYNYIHSLNKKGMTPPDIASILTISTHEANQLVRLAELSTN